MIADEAPADQPEGVFHSPAAAALPDDPGLDVLAAEVQDHGVSVELRLHAEAPFPSQARGTADLMARLMAAEAGAALLRRRLGEAEADIAQRDALLRESHHRITNNIASVASLLQMQARTQSQPAARRELLEAVGRVQTFGRIHESLYRSGEVQTIAIGDHLSGLLAEVAATGWARSGTAPEVVVECPDTASLPTAAATTLSLIAVELVMNALKHAGKAEPHLRIAVSFDLGDPLALRVSDNGPGFPVQWRREAPTFGLTLVDALTRQLGGSLEFGAGPGGTGAAVVVSFPATPVG